MHTESPTDRLAAYSSARSAICRRVHRVTHLGLGLVRPCVRVGRTLASRREVVDQFDDISDERRHERSLLGGGDLLLTDQEYSPIASPRSTNTSPSMSGAVPGECRTVGARGRSTVDTQSSADNASASTGQSADVFTSPRVNRRNIVAGTGGGSSIIGEETV